MRAPKDMSVISSMNDYSNLKWPLTIASILTTLLAFILMLCFRSDAWFTYEIIHTDNASAVLNMTTYSRLLEYGSIGLWTRCSGSPTNANVNCDAWTQQSRPHSFNVIIALVACALFLSNLTVFPSWSASILILYNAHNQYIRHIVGFIWILLFLTLSFTILLLIVLLLIALTPYFSPGVYRIDTQHIHFHSGQGLFYVRFASFLAMVCLILVIGTLIWKKLITMKLMEIERSLLKQLSDDGFQPGWHRIVMAPRASMSFDPVTTGPPPYQN